MPLFKPAKPKPDSEGFYLACTSADLGHGQMRTVEVGDQKIIVTRLEEELRAFSAACPHAAGDLSRSTIYRGRIDCPEHGYRFDVRTGRTLWPPDEVCRLRQYEIVEMEGKIKIRPTSAYGRS